MKRTAGVFLMLATVGGCMSTNPTSELPGGKGYGKPPMVPGVQGPWGQPVPMIGPYAANPPSGAALAHQMLRQNVPLGMAQPQPHPLSARGGNPIRQAGGMMMPGAPSSIMQAGHMAPPGVGRPPMMTPPGLPGAPGGIQQASGYGLPAAGGFPPPGAGMPPPGAVAAMGAVQPASRSQFTSRRTQVRFAGPAGMEISWNSAGSGRSSPIEAPGRFNFSQGAVYRLKLSAIPNRPGVELYPTLEVVPSNLKTDSFIAHSAVPVYFTEEDFEQVANGNYLVKVIYLPYPQYADVAITGPEEVVSTRLEPGADPIQEAVKRGSIMLVVRLANIDLEAPNTPSMDAPNPYMNQCGPCMAGGPGMPGQHMAGMPGLPPAPGMPMTPAGLAGQPMLPPMTGRPMLPPMAGRPMLPPMAGRPMLPPGMPHPGMAPGAMPAGQPQAVPVKTPIGQPAIQPGKPITKAPATGTIQPVSDQKSMPAKKKGPSSPLLGK